jgi:hypothetical protein
VAPEMRGAASATLQRRVGNPPTSRIYSHRAKDHLPDESQEAYDSSESGLRPFRRGHSLWVGFSMAATDREPVLLENSLE